MTDFDHSLPMLLNHTLDAIMPPYREIFSRFDLTDQQWRILRVLWSSDKVTSIELSRRTLLAAPSLVRILDRMEKKNLVTRMRSTTDRREVYVMATKQGRAIEAQVQPDIEAIQTKIRATLAETEWATLETLLSKVIEGVHEEIPDDAANAGLATVTGSQV